MDQSIIKSSGSSLGGKEIVFKLSKVISKVLTGTPGRTC